MQGKFQYWETNMPIKSVSPTLVTVSFLVFFLVKIVTSADFRDEYAISPRGGDLNSTDSETTVLIFMMAL